MTKNKLISAITSRPLTCTIQKNTFTSQYVDFLCIHKKYRKQGNAPKLIYTHYIKTRQTETDNIIFLFKREGKMTSIIPLTIYYTYGFNIKFWQETLPKYNNISNILINSNSIDVFYHFCKNIQESFMGTCKL